MHRSIPVINKICFDKQIKRNWKIHQQKIYQMKSNISKQKPEQFTFLQTINKRNVLQDIKNRQVQRQNHILYKKIQSIGQNGPKNSLIKIKNPISPINHRITYHEPFRKKQLTRIFQQNQDLIKRLREKKSLYNIRKMQKQRKQVQKNISMMSSFKYKDYPLSQTFVNLCVNSDGVAQVKKQQVPNKHQKQTICISRASKSSKLRSLNKDSHHFNQICIFFHSSTKSINYKSYQITTYMKKCKFHIQVINSGNSLQKYRMQICQNQLLNILSKYYDNKIENLINHIDIDNQSQSCYLNFNKQQQNDHHRFYN